MGYDYIVNTRPNIVFYLGVIVKELLFRGRCFRN